MQHESLICSFCNQTYEKDDVDRPRICAGCGAAICEGCEVMRCDEGRHDCPLCAVSMGVCTPASESDVESESPPR